MCVAVSASFQVSQPYLLLVPVRAAPGSRPDTRPLVLLTRQFLLPQRFARQVSAESENVSDVRGRAKAPSQGILQPKVAGASSYFDFLVRHEQEYSQARLLCMPVLDQKKNVLGILEMIKAQEATSFSEADEKTFSEYAEALGLILEASLEIANQNCGQSWSPPTTLPKRIELQRYKNCLECACQGLGPLCPIAAV